MRSAPLQEAYEVGEAYLRKMEERYRETGKGDPRFHNYAVHIVHEEGTSLFYESAFAVKWKIWWIIIPEHHDMVIYADDEVLVYQYKRIWDEAEMIEAADVCVDENKFKFKHVPDEFLIESKR